MVRLACSIAVCVVIAPLPFACTPVDEGQPDAGFREGGGDDTDAGVNGPDGGTPFVCEDDAAENDTRETATVVNGDEIVSGVICADGGDDWYAVQTAPGCAVFAQMTQRPPPEGTAGDIDILLFDPSGALVGSSNTLDPVEAIQVPATMEGAYAVRLRAGSSDVVLYDLLLSSVCASDLTCPEDDRLEDNDDATHYTELVEGVGHDVITCDADEDWFSVPVTPGCVADMRMLLDNAQGDIDMELTRGTGERVALSNSSSNQERILHGIFEPGMLLRVFLYQHTGSSAYRLSVHETCQSQVACPADDPFEPNDARESGTLLYAPRDETIGVICGDDDFFTIFTNGGCMVQAQVAFTHALGDIDLELQDGSGARLAISESTSDVESVNVEVPPGVLVVNTRVFGYGGDTNVYRLQLQTTCADALTRL